MSTTRYYVTFWSGDDDRSDIEAENEQREREFQERKDDNYRLADMRETRDWLSSKIGNGDGNQAIMSKNLKQLDDEIKQAEEVQRTRYGFR